MKLIDLWTKWLDANEKVCDADGFSAAKRAVSEKLNSIAPSQEDSGAAAQNPIELIATGLFLLKQHDRPSRMKVVCHVFYVILMVLLFVFIVVGGFDLSVSPRTDKTTTFVSVITLFSAILVALRLLHRSLR